MQYYLETNSLRQVTSILDIESLINSSFSSILSIIEIASGIKDESSFNLRKPILAKILNSKLRICTNLSETLYCNAFGFNLNDDEIANGIRRVLSLIISSDSYSKFISWIKNLPDYQFYNFILQYDKSGSTVFIKSFADATMIAKNKKDKKRLLSEYYERWEKTQKVFPSNFFDDLLHHFSTKLYTNKNEINKNDERSQLEIMNSYDHSIDLFIILASYYSDQRISFGNTPGKNDYFDLNHLLYIDTNDKVIVTNDKLFNKLMQNKFSNRYITTSEFLRRINTASG